MSTTFGIITKDKEVKVAFRTYKHIEWLDPLAHLLPDETKVEPMDNSAQGIFTIGDIKEYIKKQTK